MPREASTPPRARCLAVWLAATAGAVVLAATLVPGLRGPAPGRFDGVLVLLCEVALLACAIWAWLVTTVVVLDAVRGRPGPRSGIPAGVRRAVLAACGVALAGGLTHPAYAESAQRDHGAPAALVDGLPLPDRASAVGHVGRLLALRARAGSDAVVVVRPGDTLWGLAEERLGDGAAWPRLYRVNRLVVGADPDLIRPGQRLVLPRREESR